MDFRRKRSIFAGRLRAVRTPPTLPAMTEADQGRPFQDLFRRIHARHAGCVDDEWLMQPCRGADGSLSARPIVWSRRNGPWRQVDVLWVGAAPGNAGGMGSGEMGAHGTRIPFGGDIAGGNLDVLLSGAGLDRNTTFIVAALNQLPERGGGEPRVAELLQPAGDVPTSLHLVRETLLAAGPRLVVCLGNIGLRSAVAGARAEAGRKVSLPSLARLREAGVVRGAAVTWPRSFTPDPAFMRTWIARWGPVPLPHLLWLLHPSAQNMSPYAAAGTVFHRRMVETMAALRQAVTAVLDRPLPAERPSPPDAGIYALPEWRDAVGPRHARLDELWRTRGV
jgi:uracil-DNA glycosylase